jgi:hypothetical protein
MLDSKQKTSSETADLRGGLEAADPTTLLLALVQLTGEGTGLRKPSPYIRGPMNYQEFMADRLRASIRDRLTEVLAEPGPRRKYIVPAARRRAVAQDDVGRDRRSRSGRLYRHDARGPDRRFPAIAQPEMKVFPSILADRDRRLPKPTGFEQRLQPGTATA